MARETLTPSFGKSICCGRRPGPRACSGAAPDVRGSLERGERNVSVLNLYALARALGVTAGELLP